MSRSARHVGFGKSSCNFGSTSCGSLALANFIETHSFQKELGSNILIMGIDNEKYINHSKDPNVDDDGITLKDIKVGDEIVMDYRGFDDNIEAWLT